MNRMMLDDNYLARTLSIPQNRPSDPVRRNTPAHITERMDAIRYSVITDDGLLIEQSWSNRVTITDLTQF